MYESNKLASHKLSDFKRLADIPKATRVIGMPPNEVRFGIPKPRPNAVGLGTVVIGRGVAQDLGWQPGTHVDISFNDDALLLTPTVSSNWKLKAAGKNAVMLTFSTTGTKFAKVRNRVPRHKTEYYQTEDNELIVAW